MQTTTSRPASGTTYDLIEARQLRDGDVIVRNDGGKLTVASAVHNVRRNRIDVRFARVRGEFHYPLDWNTWIVSRSNGGA
jgi:hypothetical protein